MPTSDMRRIFDAAEQLGFDEPCLRGGGHYMVTHPTAGQSVFFPATPSEFRGIDNVIAELQRAAGRRLSKPRGYSGGKRFSPEKPIDMHARTLAEQHSAEMRVQCIDRIEEIDVEIRDLVERVDLGRCPAISATAQIKSLLRSRQHGVERLEAHLGVPPQLDIPGLDALVSTAPDDSPASADELEQLRKRFSE